MNLISRIIKCLTGTKHIEHDKLMPNDKCYCGSGKKYKKCHMQIDQKEDIEIIEANNIVARNKSNEAWGASTIASRAFDRMAGKK
jgi:hypothetical protein